MSESAPKPEPQQAEPRPTAQRPTKQRQTAQRPTERWQAPAIDGSDGRGFLTAERLQALQKDAYDEAYAAGRRDGLKAGEAAAAERAARLDELLTALAKPFEELDESVEQQLVELSIAIAKQLFRREIQIDPSHVIGVVRDTVPLLPVASRDVKVHLHPDDAALLRESFADGSEDLAWGIVEDPLLSRGGLKVSSEHSHIDAQAETRFQAVVDVIVEKIAGDERRQ